MIRFIKTTTRFLNNELTPEEMVVHAFRFARYTCLLAIVPSLMALADTNDRMLWIVMAGALLGTGVCLYREAERFSER